MIAEHQEYHLQVKDVATGEDLSGCHTIPADRAIIAVVGELLFRCGRVSKKKKYEEEHVEFQVLGFRT